MSAWTAGTPGARARLIDFVKDSGGLNAVIIDIKDSTGIVSYTGNDDVIESLGTYSKRIRNVSSVIQEFHDNDIYVIGRVTAFEDPYLATKHDSFVLGNTNGCRWRSNRGIRQWIDPVNTEYHDYIFRIAREAYSLGFDEVNLDYVRYPSEGSTNAIAIRN